MDGRQHERRQRRRDELAAMRGDLETRPSSACAAVAPRQHDGARLDERDLGRRATGGRPDLAGARLLVDAPLAARLPVEMLHDVRDVDIARGRCPPAASARSSSLPAGPTNGWPLEIFLIAGLFADEHQLGTARPFAEHRLGARASTGRRLGSRCAAARTARASADRESGVSRGTVLAIVSRGGRLHLRWRRSRRCAAGRSAWRASSRCPRAPASSSSDIAASSPRAGRSQTARGCHAGSSRPAAPRSTDTPPGRCRSRTRACRCRRRSSSGMSPRCSIVRYEMQRVAVEHAGATSACVGHASRHSVQVPH